MNCKIRVLNTYIFLTRLSILFLGSVTVVGSAKLDENSEILSILVITAFSFAAYLFIVVLPDLSEKKKNTPYITYENTHDSLKTILIKRYKPKLIKTLQYMKWFLILLGLAILLNFSKILDTIIQISN